MKLSCIFPIILLSASAISARVTSITKLDGSLIRTVEIERTIPDRMAAAGVTGLGLAILNDNRIVYIKMFGFRNKARSELLDENTVMRGASLSKAVFSYLVLQLVQEGVLDLDKPLCRYFDKPLPEYDDFRDLSSDDRWRSITARMCLSHTTGFPNLRWLNPRGNRKLEIFFTPGTRYAYSGEGIQLLQLAVERITGRGLEDLARARVFGPLGMKRSSFIWQDRFEGNQATGHDDLETPIDFYGKTARAGASGSLYTTVSDYARFVEAVMRGKGLKASAKRTMLTPQIAIQSKHQFPSLADEVTDQYEAIGLSYGLGWGLYQCGYGRAFFKEGHGEGWQNYNVNFPDRKTSILIMTNSANGEKIFKDVLEKTIGDTCTPWEWEGYVPYYALEKQSVGRRLYDIIHGRGVQEALAKYREIKAKGAGSYRFDESELNDLAFQLVKEKMIGDAIELFKLNVEEYPDSADAYASLAEAYMIQGNRAMAVRYCRKSLEIDPQNAHAAEMLKTLEE